MASVEGSQKRVKEWYEAHSSISFIRRGVSDKLSLAGVLDDFAGAEPAC